MELKRHILNANPAAKLLSPIPDSCRSERTLSINAMKVLSIFRDKRPTAQAWINKNLPALLLMEPHQKEEFLRWFWDKMPENGWLEFDFGTHTLSLCVLEKVSPN